MFASKSYRNCLEAEELLMEDIRNAELSARDRAVCANALDRILERKRILKMKPAPKAVDADKYEEQKKRARRAKPVQIRDAPPMPVQPPSNAVNYEMKDAPSFPGHIMAKKSPADEVEAYPPAKPLVQDTIQTCGVNNHSTNLAVPQKMMPSPENPPKQQTSGVPLKKPPTV